MDVPDGAAALAAAGMAASAATGVGGGADPDLCITSDTTLSRRVVFEYRAQLQHQPQQCMQTLGRAPAVQHVGSSLKRDALWLACDEAAISRPCCACCCDSYPDDCSR